MRILLIRPLSRYQGLRRGRPDVIPVGLAVIASYLRKHGIDAEILDNNTECLKTDELYEYLSSRKDDFDVYGITGMAPQYTYIKHLSYIIKNLSGRPIILGGPMATYSAELVLENSAVDFCVIGEGQETALDLLSNLKTPDRVPGICYRDANGQPKRTVPRVYKEHLDDYPFPAWDLLDMSRYTKGTLFENVLKPSRSFRGKRITTLSAGMGCPYRCRYCTTATIKARFRSVDNVIAEIRELKAKYNIDGVDFADDLLIMGKDRTREFCEKIKDLNILYCGQARANTIDEEVASLLKSSGCTGYGIGVESGSNRMLRLMRKNATVEQNRKALQLGRKHDLVVKVQLLFGFPGENAESVEETISMFREVNYPPRRYQVLTPLPGSVVYDDCLDLGIIKDEDLYLDIVSRRESGFIFKKLLINLTEWDDRKFMDTLLYTEAEFEKMNKVMVRAERGIIGPAVGWRLRRIRALLSRRRSVSSDPEALRREVLETYYNFLPFLPNKSPAPKVVNDVSWKNIAPEKIDALIKRYTPTRQQTEYDTSTLDLSQGG
jgi:radical SAM superfamily enzyme YgiQ (UPF0313 family)